MTVELTQGERADLEKYNTDLAAEIAAMDDTELGMLAKRAELDATQYKSREDLVAAIKEKAAADYTAGKIELRKMVEEENRAADAQVANRSASARAVAGLNFNFCRDLPEEARSGSFSPIEGDAAFGGEYAVPNGRYRVVGSEWIFEIRGKRLVSAFVANASNNWGGDKVVQIE